VTDVPRVTFVLVSYGGRDLVVRCLDLLRAHTPQPYRVIVVDSCSPDGTGEWLAANLTGATVLLMPDNLGFGAGCNLGVGRADTEFVCFLNADVEVTDGWLAPLLAFLDGHEQVAAVAPLMTNLDGTVQESGSLIGGDGWCRAWDDPASSLLPREVDYTSAACLVVRRAAFHDVGSFWGDAPFATFDTLARSRGVASNAISWAVPYAYEKGQTATGVRQYVIANAGAGRLDIQQP